VIDRILPAAVVCVERLGKPKNTDFETGRECALEALRKLGCATPTILRGDSGEPLWPQDIVGSITHTYEYCAAVVASANEIRKLGIDAELHRGLKEGVLDIIANADEVQMIRHLPEGVHWDAVLFSAKESIYKAWFPSGGPLGWEDVSIVFHPESGTFNAANPAQLEGRFLITKNFVLTAVAETGRHVSQPRSGDRV
jgi:4'-phosphopantetheinyl transferase EntD